MSRPNRARRQYDSVCGQIGRSTWADALHSYCAAVGDPDAPCPGIGQHREAGAGHRGLQVRPARSNPRTSVDVQRHRSNARRQRCVRCRSVEIIDPSIPRIQDRVHEHCCTAIEFRDTLNLNGARRRLQGSLEVEVGLDRPEVWENVGPRPSRQPPPVEIRWQSPAEVAAVDRPGSTDDSTPP